MAQTLQKPKNTVELTAKTLRLTVAQAIVRFFAAQQAEQLDGSLAPMMGGISGIFGHGNVAGIGEALYAHRDQIPYVRGQNEQGLAHAAIAFAKQNRCRRVMGVTSSIGPGATNMLTAAALAYTNRLPVLFLPGETFASRIPDPVLQQLEDERCSETTVNTCFKPLSRYYTTITRPEQLIEALPKAAQVLMDPIHRGPVTLSLPQDVQTEAYDFPTYLFEPTVHRIFRPEPDVGQLERAAEVLSQAKRPLIIAGGGVHYSGATERLKLFSKELGIPVTETQAGKGALPWDTALNLGGIGVTGTIAVVLCIGTRLQDFTTASKTLFQNPEVRFIGINVSSFDAIKLRACPLIADADRALEALQTAVKGYCTPKTYRQQCLQEIERWNAVYNTVTTPSSELPTDAQVVAAVNDVMGDDAIVVCAAGGLPGELHRLWRPSRSDAYHLEYAYSCMGYEIAGGLGVKMACPDREVVVLVGDGSYLMLHTELVTALQLGLKLNVVVLDSHGFGCINWLQQGCGSPPFGNLLRDTKEQIVDIDFAANAASYGCHATKVSSIQELRTALENNKNISNSCVTVIDTDPSVSTPGTAWWEVAVAELSSETAVKASRKDYEAQLQYRKTLNK